VEFKAFDRMNATMGAAASRRGVLRGVLAALGAAVADGLAVAETPAKKKKGKGKAPTCRPGKVVATIPVPASGAAVTTPVLRRGQAYRLRASGYWSTNAQYGNDAYAAFPVTNPNQYERYYQNTRLGLSVDGQSADFWGAYNANHAYERTVTGQNRAISFAFSDRGYADNSGTLTVEVRCA
jgi:hypothetical protein